jgi:hypothetical protein
MLVKITGMGLPCFRGSGNRPNLTMRRRAEDFGELVVLLPPHDVCVLLRPYPLHFLIALLPARTPGFQDPGDW